VNLIDLGLRFTFLWAGNIFSEKQIVTKGENLKNFHYLFGNKDFHQKEENVI